jgi:hypothetical protein
VVLRAHLQSLLTHGNPELRYAEKRHLIIGLFDRGLTEEKIRELIRLIDWFLELPSDLQTEFRAEMYAYEQEKKMPYVTSFERLAREEGKRDGILEALAISLEARFGEAGAAFAQELHAVADVDKLRQIQRSVVLMSKSIDELRAMLNQN